MVFLDANLVIYLIEQPATFGPKVTARVTALLAVGERLAVSDLVRMECQVGPLKANFACVILDPVCGTVCWPNGADFAPEALHELMAEEIPEPAAQAGPGPDGIRRAGWPLRR